MTTVIGIRLKSGSGTGIERVVHWKISEDDGPIEGDVKAECGKTFTAGTYDNVGKDGLLCWNCVSVTTISPTKP